MRNAQVKDYISRHFSNESSALIRAREYAIEQGLKPIHISKNVGEMLHFFALLQKPKRILEIGTLGGYSTLWLARALPPEGKIITIELEQAHAKVAKENFSFAREQDRIELRIGDALDVLQDLIKEGAKTFDLIFIDGDKHQYPKYLDPCIELARSGTLILLDNLIPKRGEMGNPDPRDIEALAIYTFNQMIANHPQLQSVLFPSIVGEDGRIDAIGAILVL